MYIRPCSISRSHNSQLHSLDVYYISFPLDPSSRKYLVIGVYFLEIVQMVTTTHDIFELLAYDWCSNPKILDDAGLLWFYVPVLTGVSASNFLS